MKVTTVEELLELVAGYAKLECFADIRRHLDPVWIAQALQATGTATLRKRRLPAGQVGWLGVGMAMFRSRPIYELGDRLDLGLPGCDSLMAPRPGVDARARLGADPMEWLFGTSGQTG